MPEILFREAIKRGLAEALDKDPTVFIMGEDIGEYGGAYAVTDGDARGRAVDDLLREGRAASQKGVHLAEPAKERMALGGLVERAHAVARGRACEDAKGGRERGVDVAGGVSAAAT